MTKKRTLQILRGTTVQNDAYTGFAGELTMDTTTNELRLHDGSTTGGHIIGSGGGGSGALVIGQILEVVGTADYTPEGCLLADGAEYTKAQFPDLWANFLTDTPKLQTCTYTEYANQIAEYGFCNKFAVDTTNETFKVPTRNKYRKLVKKIINGATWANLYDDGWVEQGGIITNPAETYYTIPIEMADTNYTVFITDRTRARVSQNAGTPTSTTQFYLSTNGTGSSYSKNWQVNGYTTIPDSTSNITREFVVVANGTLNQEQMDWSAWASSLAGRATTDMNNITSTGKETVVGWGMPDFSAGVQTASNTDYIAPSNGIVFVFWGVGTNKVYINDVEKFQYIMGYSTAFSGFIPIPVFKGTKIKSSSNSITFYPCIGG